MRIIILKSDTCLVLYQLFENVIWSRFIYHAIAHKKLPSMQCYHIYSETRGVYLTKLFPQIVPMAQICGPGSQTNIYIKFSNFNSFLVTSDFTYYGGTEKLDSTYYSPGFQYRLESHSFSNFQVISELVPDLMNFNSLKLTLKIH